MAQYDPDSSGSLSLSASISSFKEESTARDARHTRWLNVKPMVAIPPRKEASTATDASKTRWLNVKSLVAMPPRKEESTARDAVRCFEDSLAEHYMRDHGCCLTPVLQGRRVFLEM